MTKTNLLAAFLVLPIVTLMAGCEECYYNIITENRSSTHIYAGKMDAWPYLPGFSAGSVMGPVTTPVPDEVTITWKTALPGGEEYMQEQTRLFDEYVASIEDWDKPLPPEPAELQKPMYPSDKFEDHSATVVLKGKVPRHLKGELILVLRDGDKIDVSYVEKNSDGS